MSIVPPLVMMMFSEEDRYGQKHPIETPELIQTKLQEFESELQDKISPEEKTDYEQAKIKCPQLLTQDFKLMFLRCETFDVTLAATRFVKYWSKRVELFGPEKAFLPLTIDQALKDDAVAMQTGFIQLLPHKDPDTGRSIMFIDPSKLDATKYDRVSMVRNVWYMMHVALQENMTTQQIGLIGLAYPRNAKFSQFDQQLNKMNMMSIRGYLPLRMSCIHMCHPPTFFRIIFPIMKVFLGARLRKRLRVHAGSDEAVLEQLYKDSGLTKAVLPTDIGGNVVLDHDKWLKERQAGGK